MYGLTFASRARVVVPTTSQCHRVALPGYCDALQHASEWFALYVTGLKERMSICMWQTCGEGHGVVTLDREGPTASALTKCAFSWKLRLLYPAPNPCLIGQVLLSEGAFQVTFFAPDHFALDHVHHNRQQQDCPERVSEYRYPSVEHRKSQVSRVAGVAEGSVCDQARYGLIGADGRTRPLDGSHEPSTHHPTATEESPSERACHPARQEGNVQASVEHQPCDQGQQVDQRWGYPNAGVVLIVCHARSSPLDPRIILAYSPDSGLGKGQPFPNPRMSASQHFSRSAFCFCCNSVNPGSIGLGQHAGQEKSRAALGGEDSEGARLDD